MSRRGCATRQITSCVVDSLGSEGSAILLGRATTWPGRGSRLTLPFCAIHFAVDDAFF